MDSRIFDLLDQWTEARREGREVNVDDLCGGCPELQDELIQKIKALEKMDWLDASIVSEADSFESLPATIGRYEVKSLIGRGGQGEVWKAFDPKLNRVVAIKIPRYVPLFHDDSFLNEARKVAHLKHPGIVPVFDVGDDRGRYFIVSEFIPGGNLAEHIRQSGFSHHTAALLVADVADALDYAHAQGYVHRDIKPENILMDDGGKPHITDFGIALSEDQPVRERLATAGTQAYMSPEQVDPESRVTVDHRSDIYAVGVLLYQLLTGRLPFVDSNQIDLWASIVSASPRTPRTIDRSISIELERICLKALSKKSFDRYSTAGDMAAEIRLAVRKKKPRRWPVLAGVFSVITIGIVAAAWIISGYHQTWQAVEVTTNRSRNLSAEVLDPVQIESPILTRVIPPKDTPPAAEAQPQVELVRPTKTRPAKPQPSSIRDAMDEMLGSAQFEVEMTTGNVSFERSDFERALKSYSKAIRFNDTNTEAYHRRGACYFNLNRNEEALPDLLKAKELAPNDAEIRKNLASTLVRLKKFDEGISEAKEAYQLATTNKKAFARIVAMALDTRALEWNKMNELEKIIADLSDAILFDPDWAESYHNRGCAYFNAQEFDKALADMDKAIQLDGRKSLYFGNRSKVHQAKGDQAAAQQDSKRAEQLDEIEAK